MGADNKYAFLNRGNLLQDFQMQLSQKRKKFSESVFAFSKFRLYFEHFEEKDDPDSWCIFELRDSEKLG